MRGLLCRLAAGAAIALALLAALPLAAQTGGDSVAGVSTLVPVRGNIYLLAGPRANTTIQIGDDGVLVVDTQPADLTDELLAAIRSLSEGPVRYIVNTHAHSDHTGGNEATARLGGVSAAGESVHRHAARIIGHENVHARMSDPPTGQRVAPVGAWPTDTFRGSKRELHFNGEPIEIIHHPAARTDGDSIVFFRRSDVVSTGGVFVTTHYPIVDLERGGSIQGVIDALNALIELTIPEHRQEGGTLLIPGRGRIADQADLVDYRDMVTIVRNRIQRLVDDGASLADVVAAEPTYEFDPRYGADAGPWTTQMFVEAVYRDLSRGN